MLSQCVQIFANTIWVHCAYLHYEFSNDWVRKGVAPSNNAVHQRPLGTVETPSSTDSIIEQQIHYGHMRVQFAHMCVICACHPPHTCLCEPLTTRGSNTRPHPCRHVVASLKPRVLDSVRPMTKPTPTRRCVLDRNSRPCGIQTIPTGSQGRRCYHRPANKYAGMLA